MSATFTDHPGEDIFKSGAALLVCPVNCVPGVMGKGLALEFAKRWPFLKRWHRERIEHGTLALGRPGAVWVGADLKVVFFPTKRHWDGPSRIDDVQWGLLGLPHAVGKVQSIAIPALGCGLGGLDWADVRPLIVEALADLPLRVMLYPPHEVQR